MLAVNYSTLRENLKKYCDVANQDLETIAPYVPDSGEGRWTVIESVDQGVATPVLTSALQMRFASRNEMGYGFRLLSLMRNAFGGHAVKQTE